MEFNHVFPIHPIQWYKYQPNQSDIKGQVKFREIGIIDLLRLIKEN